MVTFLYLRGQALAKGLALTGEVLAGSGMRRHYCRVADGWNLRGRFIENDRPYPCENSSTVW